MAKKLAKPETENESEVKNNIADLELLRTEYLRDEMVPRKALALKNKLISLHKEQIITEDEQELMELMMIHDREAGNLSDAHTEILNRIEMSRCEDECVVTIEHAPQVLYLEKDLVCKYKKDHLKKRYEVYVPRKIQSAFQYPMDLAQKLERKLPVSADEYPKEKTLIHRLYLSAKEFNAWFVPVENELVAKKTATEEVYTF
jgi:hypothetical protein